MVESKVSDPSFGRFCSSASSSAPKAAIVSLTFVPLASRVTIRVDGATAGMTWEKAEGSFLKGCSGGVTGVAVFLAPIVRAEGVIVRE
jgi:hypothetical protein